MTGTLILPDWLVTCAAEAPRRAWGVRVVGHAIDEVAPCAELLTRHPQDDRWEAPQQALAPGFVNAHTHLYGVLAHGIPLEQAPSGFWPFLEAFWWPHVEDRLDVEMICAATELRCATMLRSGVTSFYDCLEAPNALPGVLAAQAEIVRRYGLRAILSFEATERVSPENGELGLQENVAFIDACCLAGGLVSGMMCFHTTFTCSAAFIRRAFELAEARQARVHLHCSEGTHEPEYALEHFGMRPVHYYDHLGVAGGSMLASQCVQLDPSEIEVLAARGVRVTHMPLANCEVGGGIAPLPELLAAGVTVGLGSDGYIEDYFEVMRGAFLIHKASHRDPRLLPAPQVWDLATESGARALGLERVGRLAPGWEADLQLIDVASLPTPLAEHNLLEQLLLYRCQEHVRGVMIAGRVRVRDGLVIDSDLPGLLERSRQAAKRLWQPAH
jgi:cytosine/adenosine deaminase-related metal-dependent hydrolase